ncbi:MAG TPA: rhomboid family intramembrane serine protease [Candidatus Angelobacter sp.]|nr:rhomboid family intramembrane serine protease [Candidatus Angelobacter sp.]
MTTDPKCLKCGTDLTLNEHGIAPVLCDPCAGVAGKKARKSLLTGTLRDYPATTLLLAINIAVFIAMTIAGVGLINPNWNSLLNWGGDYGPFTLGGEYWRLITATFLHAGIIHIGMNMWCLYYLGPICERVFGRLQTIGIYLLTGIGGWLLSLAHTPDGLSVGASGAIFGIAGAIVAGAKFGELSLRQGEKKALISSVVSFLIISFAYGGFSSGVDNMAHIGGFVSGLLLGLPLGGFARKHKLYQVGIFAVSCAIFFAAGHQLVQDHGAKGLLARADAANERKDYRKAIRLLEKYRTDQPDDVDTLTWLGDLYSATDQRDKAAEAYQHALKINPDDEDAKDGLEDLREAALTTKK